MLREFRRHVRFTVGVRFAHGGGVLVDDLRTGRCGGQPTTSEDELCEYGEHANLGENELRNVIIETNVMVFN